MSEQTIPILPAGLMEICETLAIIKNEGHLPRLTFETYWSYIRENYSNLLNPKSIEKALGRFYYIRAIAVNTEIDDYIPLIYSFIPPVFNVEIHQDFSEPTRSIVIFRHHHVDDHKSTFNTRLGCWRYDERYLAVGLARGLLYGLEYVSHRPELIEDLKVMQKNKLLQTV